VNGRSGLLDVIAEDMRDGFAVRMKDARRCRLFWNAGKSVT